MALNLFKIDLDRSIETEFLGWLSSEELERAQSFGFDHLRSRYVVAHAALRDILSRYMRCSPSAVAFIYNEWGKPSVESGPYFNLSHSGNVAVVAVDKDLEIGVDVETGLASLTFNEMQSVLSPIELEESSDRRPTARDLLQLWVRKEAVLKAIGKGVGYDPRRITVGFSTIDFDHWQQIGAMGEGKQLTFHVLDVNMGSVACAVARRDAPIAVASVGSFAFLADPQGAHIQGVVQSAYNRES
ncbi:MAG: 4'-phosphopantetheinyl transferase superfamily protein [Mesorhizobium sp.]